MNRDIPAITAITTTTTTTVSTTAKFSSVDAWLLSGASRLRATETTGVNIFVLYIFRVNITYFITIFFLEYTECSDSLLKLFSKVNCVF